MPLDHAKLADGYVNSSTLDFGHVLVWDQQSNRVEAIYRITPQMVPNAEVDSGPRFNSKESSVSRETKLEISGSDASQTIQGEAAAQFINSTKVTLTNYNPREYRDARGVLNSSRLRRWRDSTGEQFNDARYRFVFIARVTDGDALSISRKTGGSVNADANVVKVGRYKFNVTYDNKSNTTITAEQGPLIVTPKVFSLRQEGNSYRFFHDTSTTLNFQTVKHG